MKKFFLFIIAMFGAFSIYAAVRTVSNNPSTIAQYNTIQAAVNASANGDTVYVHGSPNVYAAFDIIDKKLTIIGPGWTPDKDLGLTASITGVNLRNTTAAGSPTGSELQGLVFTNQIYLVQNVSGDLPIDDLRIIRCQFSHFVNYSLSATGHLIEGCIFYYVLSMSGNSNYTNFIFQNNIFWGNTCCASTSITGLTLSTNVLFNHNLFYSYGGNLQAFSASSSLTMSNNIFVNRNLSTGISASAFNNNLTFNGTGTNVWSINGNTNTGGNVENQDPQMVSQPSVNSGNSYPLLDFTIPAGPANNSASDGKDMGLLFDVTGSLNWFNCRNSRLPRIYKMDIINPTVAVGGSITVSVEARTSN